MTETLAIQPAPGGALHRLQEREEVLQICYWFIGEGFGDRFRPNTVKTFLNSDLGSIAEAFEALADQGDLERSGGDYVFTVEGKRKAGGLFFETFTEFQQASHGECHAGCCDSEEHDHDEACEHHPDAQPG